MGVFDCRRYKSDGGWVTALCTNDRGFTQPASWSHFDSFLMHMADTGQPFKNTINCDICKYRITWITPRLHCQIVSVTFLYPRNVFSGMGKYRFLRIYRFLPPCCLALVIPFHRTFSLSIQYVHLCLKRFWKMDEDSHVTTRGLIIGILPWEWRFEPSSQRSIAQLLRVRLQSLKRS